ncbi:hypothetical protein [Arthrobacter sp. NPDC090010]|uniref:hypothetical protein n=1 Tax=Arthrobacter sp. NPDC090010 TaxID=3363942 RepID=UPI0038160C85
MSALRGQKLYPGARARLLLGAEFLGQCQQYSATLIIPLHLVLSLHQGFVIAASAFLLYSVGSTLSGIVLSRFSSKRSLRALVIISTISQAAIWGVSPLFPGFWFLPLVAVAGFTGIPLLHTAHRSLDLIAGQERLLESHHRQTLVGGLGAILGSIGVPLLIASSSTATVLQCVAGLSFITGSLLLVAGSTILGRKHPDFGTAAEEKPGLDDASEREQFRAHPSYPRTAVLGTAVLIGGLLLNGTELTIVAVLVSGDHILSLGLVLICWTASAVLGSLSYRFMTRQIPLPVLLLGLGLLNIPLIFADGAISLMALCVLPSFFGSVLYSTVMNQTASCFAGPTQTFALRVVQGQWTIGLAFGPLMVSLLVEGIHGLPRTTGFLLCALVGVVAAAQVHSRSGWADNAVAARRATDEDSIS